jgi:hypothetical protein
VSALKNDLMKKTYAKPTLDRREKLGTVVAGASAPLNGANGN